MKIILISLENTPKLERGLTVLTSAHDPAAKNYPQALITSLSDALLSPKPKL